MRKKILVVLTSVEKYPNLNRATGVVAWRGCALCQESPGGWLCGGLCQPQRGLYADRPTQSGYGGPGNTA
jgi:hypothetical protein